MKRLRTELADQKKDHKEKMRTKDKDLSKEVDDLEIVIKDYIDNKIKIKMKKKEFKGKYKEALQKVRRHLNNNRETEGAFFMSTA